MGALDRSLRAFVVAPVAIVVAVLVGAGTVATAKIRVHSARTRLRETLATACTFELDERGVLVCDPQPESRTEEAR